MIVLSQCVLAGKGKDVKTVSVEEIVKYFASHGFILDNCVTRTQLIDYLAVNGFLPGRVEHHKHFRDNFPEEEKDHAVLCLGASFEDNGTHWAGIDIRFIAVREAKV